MASERHHRTLRVGNVTINNGGHDTSRVIVTPLTSTTVGGFTLYSNAVGISMSPNATGGHRVTMINRLLLKAVPKSGIAGKEEIFPLHNVDPSEISSCDELKDLIKKRLSGDIIAGEFNVGYFEGSNILRIRSKEDLCEVWSKLHTNTKTTLWCDGLHANTEKGEVSKAAKRGRDSNDNNSGKKKQDREEKVQEIVENLKQKHSESKFTTMQIRIWAEMVVSGMYSSLDEPPKTSMFGRAGDGSPQKKTKKSEVAQALSDAATAITSVISTNVQGASSTNSDNSVIERRSRLYRQLNELRELQSTGVLTGDEYKTEKDSIMKLLAQLKS